MAPRRPFARLCVVAALIALAHGVLIAWAWHGAAAKEKPRAVKRVAIRLVAPAAPRAVVPVPVVKKAAPQKRPSRPPPAAQAAPEAVSGAVFALPRIGFGAPGPARWVNPPPMPAPPPPALMASAQAARTMVLDALQRQMSEMPVPAADGACALQLEPAAHLACDSEDVREALSGRQEVLAGLLVAYRQFHPQAVQLGIAYTQGRYWLNP